MLRQNIINCCYFREMVVRNYSDLVVEVERACTHAEPWAPGGQGVPSPFFCCLYRLMTMGVQGNQVRGLADYRPNQYVRILGFLYIRYLCDPSQLWSWMKKYILEEDELQLSLDRSKTITVGEFIEQLLTDQQYFSTRLPRIPQQHETRIQAMIIVAREKRQRRVINQRLSELFVTGVPVRAISSIDDEWYIGVIERFEGRVLLVRFTEKNVIEPVDLGEVELMPDDEEGTQQFASLVQERFQDVGVDVQAQSHKHKHRSRSRSRKRSSRSPKQKQNFQSNKDKQKQMEREIREKRMSRAVADNKGDVARIPASYKQSLSQALPSTTHAKKDASPSPRREEKFIKLKSSITQEVIVPEHPTSYPTPEAILFQQDLKKKYGDASALARAEYRTASDNLNQDYV